MDPNVTNNHMLNAQLMAERLADHLAKLVEPTPLQQRIRRAAIQLAHAITKWRTQYHYTELRPR